MKLRRPEEKLAGCMWLPRFIDKCRHHFAGTLAQDYQRPFCSPLATDGLFLAHFGLKEDHILAAIRAAESDAAIAAWFLAQVPDAAARITAWNHLAPDIGRPGFPGERGFHWARQHLYRECHDPRVTSAFTAIAWDEGYLGESGPPLPASSAAPPFSAPTPTPMIHVTRAAEAQPRNSFGVAFDLLATGPQCMMTKMHYRVGNFIPFHAHPNEQIGYVLFGRIRVLTRNSTHELGPGDTYAIPAGVEHSIEILEDADEVQVFTPPRPEFR